MHDSWPHYVFMLEHDSISDLLGPCLFNEDFECAVVELISANVPPINAGLCPGTVFFFITLHVTFKGVRGMRSKLKHPCIYA